MSGLLAWAAIALAAGLALVILEVFIPSGGLLGFLAFTALITSIVLAFMYDKAAGFGFLIAVMLALPATIVFALNRLPHTPIGRRMILDNPDSKDVLPEGNQSLRELVGQVGKAKTKMLPSGAITIGKRSIDAVSEGTPIDPGQLVRVVEVRGNRVVVSPIDEDEILSEPEGDDLSRPIESLGLDSLDDPLS